MYNVTWILGVFQTSQQHIGNTNNQREPAVDLQPAHTALQAEFWETGMGG